MTRLRAAAVALLLATTAAAPPPNLAAATARFESLMSFYIGNAPLTPADRQAVAAATQRFFQASPNAAASEDALNVKILAALSRREPRLTAKLRAIARYALATPSPSSDPAQRAMHDALASIATARDPVVVLDTRHHGVISRYTASLMALQNGAASALLGLPLPDSVPGSILAAQLAADYPHLDEPAQAAFAQAERGLPTGLPWLRSLKPASRDALAAHVRPLILQAPGLPERELRLAQVMAEASARNSAAEGQNLMLRSFFLSRLRMQGLAQSALNATATHY